MTFQEILDKIPHIPPSVASVLKALYEQQPQTGQQLREKTGLPRRTVYAGLQRLKELGLLHERVSLRDARQSYFWVDLVPLARQAPPARADTSEIAMAA